jgi:hypothetical protein
VYAAEGEDYDENGGAGKWDLIYVIVAEQIADTSGIQEKSS